MQLVYSIHFYVHSSCNYILLYLCSSITEEINKYMEYNGCFTPTAVPQRLDGALKIYHKSCDRREIFPN